MDDRLLVNEGTLSEMSTLDAYESLRTQLQGLRLRSGRPTYRDLAGAWRTAQGAPTGPDGYPVTLFAASTIGDNLNGNRTSRSMSWPFVRFFVLACQRCACKLGIELSARDQELRLWQERDGAIVLNELTSADQRPRSDFKLLNGRAFRGQQRVRCSSFIE